MRTNHFESLVTIMMVAMLSTSFASCGGDDDNLISQILQIPEIPFVPEADPVGTVEVNFKIGNSSNPIAIGGNTYNLRNDIYIDDAGNFQERYNSVIFVSVGQVNGLSGIKSIPAKGWTSNVAATPGTGYIIKHYSNLYGNEWHFTRMYVESVSSSEVKVKYQYPFLVPIRCKQSHFNIDKTSHGWENGKNIIVELEEPTEITIVSYPKWTSGSRFASPTFWFVDKPYIDINVKENNTGQTRTGEIVLKNDVSTATITIVQEG